MHRLPVQLASILLLASLSSARCGELAANPGSAWPEVTTTVKPWAYCWWLGSAVDRTNIAKELRRYHDAGLGGIHIIPIYGAKGYEDRYISYLSPKWMEMVRFTIEEARRLDMDVDMTLGTGWCFGGPTVAEHESGLRAACTVIDVPAGGKLETQFAPKSVLALVAYDAAGKPTEITGRVDAQGHVAWKPAQGAWKVYAVLEKSRRQKVKRAAPGGEGYMLNPFYGEAIQHYLTRFDEAFKTYGGPMPRAVYQDSYEYASEWSPDLFQEFEKRCGYRLQDHLPQIFAAGRDELTARVKCDYRETISSMMVENVTGRWTAWAREHKMLSRNQAHGSPGNLLDLYASADIPETEMFSRDREMLICKFASSAAHVSAGKPLVSSETGTWLAEHFTERLEDMKRLVDEFFVSGINHVFYHGTCYSPDDAPWPGWLFYAATEMNPRNPIWHDVPALNAYIARCQSVLQAGSSDNDVLLYWPIHDLWHDHQGLVKTLTVHQRDWLNKQPIGKTARVLWTRGYAFDYISDRQLQLNVGGGTGGAIHMRNDGDYRVLVVPPSTHMPLETMERLKRLADDGATIVFEEHLPQDVPGLGALEARRQALHKLIADLRFREAATPVQEASVGSGRFLVGDLEASLQFAKIPRETLVDQGELLFVRRKAGQEHRYLVCNHGRQAFEGWITPAVTAASILLMDPMTGRIGLAATRLHGQGQSQVYLQLPAGGSMILRTDPPGAIQSPAWTYWQVQGNPIALVGTLKVEFLEGGPVLPKPFATARLASWTELGDEQAKRFAGTARYRIEFDAPREGKHFRLDLGQVCQSARVRLNGRDVGTLILSPFQTVIDELKPAGNVLEIDVTNVAANRLRDLDRRHVIWRKFNDINFASMSYKSFDASNWPLYDSGLLGPVTLQPVKIWPAL
jgi:hypothetical protein